MKTDYDVLIVGSGMVGAAIANALGGSDLTIGIIENHTPQMQWPPEHFDIRVSAITRASQNLFENLGVWQGMEQRRITPYNQMHVWDNTGGHGEIHFDAAEINEPNLGHIIENSVIQSAFVERFADFDNIEFICPVNFTRLAFEKDHAWLELDDGKKLTAKLIIGADGANSRVRQIAGISVKGWQYDHKAVVTVVKTEKSHQNAAWQRFLPTGPLAFLPLENGYSSIVWSTSPSLADQLVAMDVELFKQDLEQAFESKLGTITEVGQRGAFQLKLQHTTNYTRPRLALAGDAAHAVHPLAGQGVNLGLLDAAALTEVVLEAHQAGQDIGSHQILRRFERWRKGDNLAMLAAMDGFKRLFGNQTAPVQFMRHLGLNMTNRATPLKNFLVKYGMGYKGDLPKACR
ncbi:MAG TPA: hypothetical protein ENJ07_01730 [Gammaproteobacteria bacterium]|nr:hypothetical protein [Gammaproteobacteria bacterium]